MRKIILSIIFAAIIICSSIPIPTYADPALPLKSLQITGIYTSNYAYGHVLPAPDQDSWHPYSLTENGSRASLPNDRKYVRIDYIQMGDLVGTSIITLDGQRPLTGNVLTGLDENGKEIGYGMNYGYLKCDVFEINPIDPDVGLSEYKIKLMDSRAPDHKTLEATLNIKWLGRPDGPPVPKINYNDSMNPGKAVVTGVDSSMEYRNKSYVFDWTPIESNRLVFDIYSSSYSYYLRYAATDTEKASEVTEFNILGPSTPSIIYDRTSEKFTGLTTGMEVKVNEGAYVPVDDYWISGNAASNIIESLSPGESAILNFRKVATSNAPLSNEKVITLDSRLEKPTTLEFDPVTYVLTGTNSSMQYRVKGAAAWTSISSTSIDLSSLINNLSETIIEVRYKPTSTNSASQTVDITLPQKVPAPSDLSLDLAKELITGCVTGKTYQYSTNGSSWTNVTATDGSFSITSLISTSAKTLYVREAATSTIPYTDSVQFSIPARPAIPKVTINTTTELLSGVTTDQEISINGGTYTALTSEMVTAYTSGTAVSDLLDDVELGESTTLSFRVPASATKPASKEKVITLYSRLGKPTTLEFDPVTYVLTGTSSSMQYRVKGAAAWTSISSSSVNLSSLINNLSETIIEVRYKPTSTNSASQTVDITLPKQTPAPSGLSLDLAKELITGCVTGKTYQYSTNGSSWTNVTATDGSFSITSVISTSTKTLYVREAATSTTPYTNSVQFSIPTRPTAPSTDVVKMVYDDPLHPDKAVLTGLDSTMEYKLSSESNWTAFDGVNPVFDIPASSKTYHVRYKGTSDGFPSNNASVTLTIRATAPSVTINTTTELLSGSGVTTDREISINGGAYSMITSEMVTAYTSGTAVSDLIDDVELGESTTLSFRIPASATKPASKEKVITLYSRLGKPTTLEFDPVTYALTGTSSSMQYRVKGADTWTSVSSSSINLSSLINNLSETIIEVRYKPTSANSASKTVDITLPKQTPAPSGLSLDLAKELITGCVTGKTYQYSTNGSSWTNVTATDGSFSITSVISTSAKTLYVREAATSTTPYTDSVQFSIPARPTAPSTAVVKMVYDDPLHPDKAVLTGLDSTMEYKLSSESNWIAFDGVNPVFDIPASSKTYHVRYKGTSDGFPSNNASVTLTIRATAPSVTINTTTELLSGVTTGREISINGGAYTMMTSEMVTAYTSGTAVSDLIDDIELGESITLSFRIHASTTKPASKEKVITLYARADTPSLTGLAYNALNRRITGTSSSMLWRVPGGSWSTCSTYITTPTGSTEIEFAMKATSFASRSWVATFYIAETDAEAMPQNNIKESLVPDETTIIEEPKDSNPVDITPNTDEKIPSEDIDNRENINGEQSQPTETPDFETQDDNLQE